MKRSPRSVMTLVDQQVKRWSTDKTGRRIEPGLHRPVITISRQYGALGAALAGVLGERTGYPVWDREILHEIAEHARAPEVMFMSLDEHRRNAISETLAIFGGGRHVTGDDYLRALMRVVHTIADHGAAVIVGRGAQYILDPDDALHVRVVRPFELRVEGVAQRKSMSVEEARGHVEAVEADRKEFIRQYFDRDSDAAADYDLIVNTGTLPLDRAADLVIAAYEARFGVSPS